MTPELFLDHALNELDDDARDSLEQAFASDVDLADKYARFETSLRLLLDDGRDDLTPPSGLAFRAIRLVSEHRETFPTTDTGPIVLPFRWTDIAVAAGILLAGVLTLLPAVERGRDRMERAGCALNLSRLGQSLTQYAMANHTYPKVSDKHPVQHVGSFIYDLNESGLLSDVNDLRCGHSSVPEGSGPLPKLQQLVSLRDRSPEDFRKRLSSDFAYNVGSRMDSGEVEPVKLNTTYPLPLLADAPPHDGVDSILDGNSPNHRGRGQNVLYTDLHVGWHPSRIVDLRDNDVYLNEDRRPAPGVRQGDVALLPAVFRSPSR